MTYPSSDVVTTNTDATGDSPALARVDILDLMQKFNLLRNHISTFIQGLLSSTDAAAARGTLGAAPIASPTFTGTVTAPDFTGALTGNASTATSSVTAGNLSGTPALPNGTMAALQAVADSSPKLATTAFVNPSFNISGSGWVKLPSGLFLQWMPFTTASGTVNITWPIAFPTAVYGVVASTLNGTNVVTTVNTRNTTGAIIFTHVGSTGAGISNTGFVIAFGI